MRSIFQHHLNGMHVYCRLVEMGFPKGKARKLAMKWEVITKKVLYRDFLKV